MYTRIASVKPWAKQRSNVKKPSNGNKETPLGSSEEKKYDSSSRRGRQTKYDEEKDKDNAIKSFNGTKKTTQSVKIKDKPRSFIRENTIGRPPRKGDNVERDDKDRALENKQRSDVSENVVARPPEEKYNVKRDNEIDKNNERKNPTKPLTLENRQRSDASENSKGRQSENRVSKDFEYKTQSSNTTEMSTQTLEEDFEKLRSDIFESIQPTYTPKDNIKPDSNVNSKEEPVPTITLPSSQTATQSIENHQILTNHQTRNEKNIKNVSTMPNILMEENELPSANPEDSIPNNAKINLIYTWKIDNFKKAKDDADKNGKVAITSSFYTEQHGYKLCLILYPFGNFTSRGTYISLYFAIMQGEYDDQLPWPFRARISVSVLDQDSGVESFMRVLRPPSHSDRFQKPTNSSNAKVGWLKYMSLEELLTDSKYCRNDTIFLNVYMSGD